MTEFNPIAVAGHNNPPEQSILDQIADLYDEAKNWADGEPITSQEMADAITLLREQIHEAGKKADAERIAEKKPHDDAAAAVQAKFNPFIQPKKGKVDLAKAALDDLLTPWRKKKADEAAAEARRIAEEAEAARAAAQEAMRASSGNLAAREEAEAVLAEAKKLEKTAKRADKAATTGTGLRTYWVVEMVDQEAALDWAYNRAPGDFITAAQALAEAVVRQGVRQVPGFVVREEKRAA